MYKTEDIIIEVENIKKTLEQYLGYDSMVGGLISRSIKNLTDAQTLLENPSSKNAEEALAKVQIVKNDLSPYGSYAPKFMVDFNSLVDKISKLEK